MLYMVIEHYKNPTEVYRRFHEKGRMMPEGVSYVNSWVSDLPIWKSQNASGWHMMVRRQMKCNFQCVRGTCINLNFGVGMEKRLNSNHLKIIAIIAMTIDHFTDLFYPGYPAEALPIAMHLIGRLTAPIMWFFIAEGYHHTKNIGKYIFRLGLFAIVSHFAYCFAFGINCIPLKTGIFNQTSVMYPLFIAVVVMWLDDLKTEKLNTKLKTAIIFVLIWSAFPADWSCIAVLAILQIKKYRGNLSKQMLSIMGWVLVYAIVSFFFVSKVYGAFCLGVILVYPFLRMYNGERGKTKWLKWFFYIYYPAHLIILGILRIYVYGADAGLLF